MSVDSAISPVPALAERCASPVHVVATRAGQRFALSVTTVWEVLTMPELEPVPLGPGELLGSFQLRGEIVPAMLADALLAVGESTAKPAVLALLRGEGTTVALAFDRVLGVTTIEPGAMLSHPMSSSRPWLAHLRMDARHQLITVLDGPSLLSALVERSRFDVAST